MPTAEYDVIVYGASGYTGRLVAEYLSQTYGQGDSVSWAMAGRNADKLAEVKTEIGAPATTDILTADASDAAALADLAGRTRCIISTTGPYQLYGEKLIEACVEAGTGYVDLCGEVNFMHAMIDKHQSRAQETGARIVFSCGFDSIPFDLGVFFLQEEAKKRFGAPLPHVRGRVRSMNGTFSGGTFASGRATMEALQRDPSLFDVLVNPHSLTPDAKGPAQPADNAAREDEVLGTWLAPFVMAAINSKNVHRSNALLGHAYGRDFQYDEMMVTGSGERGKQMAEAMAETDMFAAAGDDAPKPGEGPSKAEREAGSYDILFYGKASDGSVLKAAVQGDLDPGYGSTSRMLGESGVCLAKDSLGIGGGFYTTAAAFGDHLIRRLTMNAGLRFNIED